MANFYQRQREMSSDEEEENNPWGYKAQPEDTYFDADDVEEHGFEPRQEQ